MTVAEKDGTAETGADASENTPNDFAAQADEQAPGLVGEFWDFLRYNKKWWLTPVIVVLLAMGALIIFSSGAAAPFIYTLF